MVTLKTVPLKNAKEQNRFDHKFDPKVRQMWWASKLKPRWVHGMGEGLGELPEDIPDRVK